MATNWAIISACHAPSRCPKLGITTVWFSHFAVKKNHRISIQFMLSMRTIFNPADDLINSPYMTSRPREFREHQSHIFGPRFFSWQRVGWTGDAAYLWYKLFLCVCAGWWEYETPGWNKNLQTICLTQSPNYPYTVRSSSLITLFLTRWPV